MRHVHADASGLFSPKPFHFQRSLVGQHLIVEAAALDLHNKKHSHLQLYQPAGKFRGNRACTTASSQPEGRQPHSESSRRQTLGILATAAVLSTLPKRALSSNDLGQSLLEQRTSEFTLPNGLHFIVLERHNAPVLSCHTYANVGAFEEVNGQTGMAHMLEHEAFKGSERIGTTDWSKEAPLLDAQDEVFYSLRHAQQQGQLAEAKRLSQQLLDLQKRAAQFSIPNDFGARLQRAGAVGLNASTSHDATRYVTSLPSNVLELWFALEAERFQVPVFRELYSEKRVVLEERRARVDNSPLGKFQEEFNQRAFANNYSRPVIGFQEDIEAFGRQELQDFFRRHYGPNNLTIAIVGDVSPDQVYRFADKYFGGWALASQPQASAARERWPSRPSGGERRLELSATAGPALMKAFYRGAVDSQDAVVLEVIADVLTGGRTSRLERRLVQTGQAFSTSFLPAYPGDKYPCASMLYAIPATGVSLAQMDRMLMDEAGALASDGVTDKELQRIRKAAKLDLVEAIRFNASMAASLCSYHALTGSWKTVLQDLAQVDALTSDRVRDVAARLFTDDCFTGFVTPKGPVRIPQQPAQAL